MEAGTVMREQEGRGSKYGEKVGGRKKRQGEREEPRGLSREGVNAGSRGAEGDSRGREMDRIAWSARGWLV